jgi:hypothetical protein
MIKAIFFLKRKAGLSHEQFRTHYENSHARLGQKYFGHLLISYTRNYVGQVRRSRSHGLAEAEWDYDCITEWTLPSQEALEEVYRILADPDIGQVFHEDEDRFLDRDALYSVTCREDDVVNTGTGGGLDVSLQ